MGATADTHTGEILDPLVVHLVKAFMALLLRFALGFPLSRRLSGSRKSRGPTRAMSSQGQNSGLEIPIGTGE